MSQTFQTPKRTNVFQNQIRYSVNLCFNAMQRGAFASFISGGFTVMAVINQPEKKLAKRTSLQCMYLVDQSYSYFQQTSKQKLNSIFFFGLWLFDDVEDEDVGILKSRTFYT
jgi:hypothetical protein